MANRLFSPKTQKLGSLGKGLRALAFDSARDYSNQGWRRKTTYPEHVLFSHAPDRPGSTIWPDPNLGCLGAKDKRFCMPGHVGLEERSLDPEIEGSSLEELQADKKAADEELAFWKKLCDTPSNFQRQIDVLKHHDAVEQFKEEEMAALDKSLKKLLNANDTDTLECTAQSCPELLRRELTGLFKSVSLTNGPLTVITICNKTKNDMSGWSAEVEGERDLLVENFIKTAKELCKELRSRAQWADFIDPASGRPFYGPYTNTTFFETDERYRQLGFRLVDLGCCKVIAHQKWGTHAFVGTIFTSAPHDSEYLEEIMSTYNTNWKE